MGLACIAIVGKRNNPVYIRTLGATSLIDFHFLVHASLDVVDERGEWVPGKITKAVGRLDRRFGCMLFILAARGKLLS